ncbi:Mur ligase family protein [Buchnera aphidicola]|uniref:Mur ligase family protein n=1 Tax=Buchnera aphidicola TaxID=9 RepID=UPI003BEF0BE1
MISLSLKKISSITEGILHGSNLIIHDIMINSKKIIPGSLFIALIGKKFDAHIFIKEAIKNGCVAIITQKKINYPISYIIVKNTSIALGKIASWIRIFLNTKVIAITGSAGKTSVKDMTTSILQTNKKIISTIDNNNSNNINVPITLLQLKKEHKYAIIELGANTPGEILYTSHISKPNVILINNIYHAHLEGFKSLLGVSKAKEEIFYGLQKNGIVILNLDSHHFSRWKKKIKNKKTIFFSIKKKKIVIFLLVILILIFITLLLFYIHQMEK